jgi:nucleoside-diphosphate-sugar epimerase
MRILVTGGTGFIGRNLIGRLLGEGHEVFCLVRGTSRRKRLADLGSAFVEGDIIDAESFMNALTRIAPDVVYHCAARVWDKDEKSLFLSNVEGTLNVCRACHEQGVGRLIYLSSVAVVSGNVVTPLTDELPYKSSDAYGKSKIEAEKIAVEYRERGLRTSIIRPCMVYGEEEPHALDKIIRAVKFRRIPILDVSGMDSKLALVYVGNVVDVLILALYKEEALKGTFMVADREIITIRKFLEIIADELGCKSPFTVPGWAVHVISVLPPVRRKMKRFFKDRVYDISRAEHILGYRPGISTEDGLRRTVRQWVARENFKFPDRSEGFNVASI